MAGGFV